MPGPGEDYSTFADLITEAHKRGFEGLTTELVDYKMEDGKPIYAIVMATAHFESGNYEGIGDATRENTNRGIGPHLIRMASTRAMARALRVALGVGKTAIEELGGASGSSEESQSDTPVSTSTSSATPAQVKILRVLANDLFADKEEHLEGYEWLQRELGAPLEELTEANAKRLIDGYQARWDKRSKEAS